jgi:hypothetical protein
MNSIGILSWKRGKYLFVKPDFAVEVFETETVKVFVFFGVVDVHFGHGCVEDSFASECKFCFVLNTYISQVPFPSTATGVKVI